MSADGPQVVDAVEDKVRRAIEAATQREQAQKACTEHINEVLKTYKCRLVAAMELSEGSVKSRVLVLPQVQSED